MLRNFLHEVKNMHTKLALADPLWARPLAGLLGGQLGWCLAHWWECWWERWAPGGYKYKNCAHLLACFLSTNSTSAHTHRHTDRKHFQKVSLVLQNRRRGQQKLSGWGGGGECCWDTPSPLLNSNLLRGQQMLLSLGHWWKSLPCRWAKRRGKSSMPERR